MSDTPRPPQMAKRSPQPQSSATQSQRPPQSQKQRPTKCPNAYNSATSSSFMRTESKKPVQKDPKK